MDKSYKTFNLKTLVPLKNRVQCSHTQLWYSIIKCSGKQLIQATCQVKSKSQSALSAAVWPQFQWQVMTPQIRPSPVCIDGVLGSRGWAFDWHNCWRSNSPLTPQPPNWVPQNLPSNYDQILAHGTTLRTLLCRYSSCKCTKIFSGFSLKFAG